MKPLNSPIKQQALRGGGGGGGGGPDGWRSTKPLRAHMVWRLTHPQKTWEGEPRGGMHGQEEETGTRRGGGGGGGGLAARYEHSETSAHVSHARGKT